VRFHHDPELPGRIRTPVRRRHEAAVAIAVGLAFPALAAMVLWLDPWSVAERFDPLDRGHQVAAVSLLTLVLLGATSAWLLLLSPTSPTDPEPRRWPLTAAGLAGTASGVWAVGAMLALHGTPWSFFADQGDAGRYIEWAADLGARPAEYPPGGLWLLRGVAAVLGLSEAAALKPTTILVMALTGPLAYLAWRLVSGPTFALYAGVVVAVPFWHSYLPMRRIVLFLILPVIVAGARALLAERPLPGLGNLGRTAALGAALGLLVLVYSGWTYFIAFALLPLAVLGIVRLLRDEPRARRTRLGLLAALVVPALLLVSPYVLPMLVDTSARPTALVDDYAPNIEAALASVPSAFLGETGLGLTLVVPVALLAVVVLRVRRSLLDLLIVAALGSAVVFRLLLLLRFGITENAGLFQRTTPVIGYLLLVAAVRGVVLLARAGADTTVPIAKVASAGRAFRQMALVAAAVLLVVNVPVDINAFMPAEDGPGRFARVAHTTDPP
jgi:hypothetical protein